MQWDDPAPFDAALSLGEALLTPTRIYVAACLAAIRATGAVKALAHITGGGFPDNIPRVLPQGLGVRLDLACVPVLPVFQWLAAAGGIAEAEMLRTFNCGIGMVAIVSPRPRRRGRSGARAGRRQRRAARRGDRGGRRARRLYRAARPRTWG